MIRLLATDLDGTLLQSSGTISQENLNSLAKAKNEGLQVVFVTGRPPRWMDTIVSMTGHQGLAICANGAITMDLMTQEILSAVHIDGTVGLEVCSRLRSVDPDITFAAELSTSHDNFVLDQNYVPRWADGTAPVRMPVEQMFATDAVVKLMARPSLAKRYEVDALLQDALAAVDGYVDVTHSDIHDVLLEMSAFGVNKGTGLAAYARTLSLEPAQIAAVGDMPNDVEMIRWAGCGAAVENAHEQVKAVANVHLPSNDDHAVAVLIHSLLDDE